MLNIKYDFSPLNRVRIYAHSYKSLDNEGSVIYVASFSKLIAPGLRMGYVNAPIEVMKRLNYLKTSQYHSC